MSKISAVVNLLKQPRQIAYNFLMRYPWLIQNDRKYIELIWKHRMNYPLNLENPKKYNEKLQWIKLYDRRDIYTTMVDKYEAKKFVASIIGDKYIIPTLAIWNTIDEIDISILPDQFVLKTTHDSGGVVICRGKKTFDLQKAKEKLERSLKRDFYIMGREWPYKNVSRRILAEQYMEDRETKELRDYKFFCFNGVPKALFIATDRQNRKEPYFDFFDMEFNHIDMRHGHPNAPHLPEKPKCFEEMKVLAARLSRGYPHIRVDLYEVNGKVYFGELTLFHHTGMVNFEPASWDDTFGEWLDLSQIEKTV